MLPLEGFVSSYVLALVFGLLAWERGWLLGGQLAMIWLAHISFDRMIGFGLKFAGDFRYTHLQASANQTGT